jgi:beta-phosphoglucomutase-like phosphatase (HAD superfamily)
MYIRGDWIEKTEFHELAGDEVLREVRARCLNTVEQGKLPVVVFDLDSTLFDVSKRSFEILKDWLRDPESAAFAETRERLNGLAPSDMRYSLEDVWSIKKIPCDEPPFDHHLKQAKRFWRKRFFGNDYLVHDEPTPGAVDFVKTLHSEGAMIVYLTGRDVPLMAFGTFDQLKSHGLPIEVERTRLILKPKRHLDDLDFKTGVAKTVSGYGKVVASFENEPKNLVAMASAFPEDTMNIFIESVSSDHPAPSGRGIYRIREFHF